MYLEILKMQFKRVWLIYFLITVLFCGLFMFSPFSFEPDGLNLSIFALNCGIMLALAQWSFPSRYLLVLPMSVRNHQLGLHLSALIGVFFPTLLLIILYMSGLRDFILQKCYGNYLFSLFEFYEIKMILLGLFFQLAVFHATYLIVIGRKWKQSLKPGVLVSNGSMAVSSIFYSILVGFLILISFAFTDNMNNIFLLAVPMLLLGVFIIYVNPFKREIIVDSLINGGTYLVSRRRLALYVILWGIMISIGLFYFIMIMKNILKYFYSHNYIMSSDIYSFKMCFTIYAVFMFFIFIFRMVSERRSRTANMKGVLYSFIAALFPPLIPFVHYYRGTRITGMKYVLEEYYKKEHLADFSGDLDCKSAFLSGNRYFIYLVIMFSVLASVGTFFLMSFNKIPSINIPTSTPVRILSVDSNPSGLQLTVTYANGNIRKIQLPAQVPDYEIFEWRKITADGYFYLGSAGTDKNHHTVQFISDSKLMKLRKIFIEFKSNPIGRNELVKSLSSEDLNILTKPIFSNNLANRDNVFNIFLSEDQYFEFVENIHRENLTRDEDINKKVTACINDIIADPYDFFTQRDSSYKMQSCYIKPLIEALPYFKNKFKEQVISKGSCYSLLGKHLLSSEAWMFSLFQKNPDERLKALAVSGISRWKYYMIGLGDDFCWNYLLSICKNSSEKLAVIDTLINKISHSKKSNNIFINARWGLYDIIAENRPYFVLNESQHFLSVSELLKLKIPEISDYLLNVYKLNNFFTECDFKEIVSSQNEYLLPLLTAFSASDNMLDPKSEKKINNKRYADMKFIKERGPALRKYITESLCCYDGKLTEAWVDYIRKEGTAEDKSLLEKTLKENYSCYRKK